MTDWKHNELLNDLADHCRSQGKIVFRDQNIGPAGMPRPDVLAINKSYNRWNPTVFEVKVSRSDFLSDVKSGKWAKYFDAASRVSFAVPAGLVKKTEIPAKAGLIVRHDKVWRYAKKPTVEPVDNFDRWLWMALLMQLDGWSKQGNTRPRAADFSRASQERHELGEKIHRYLMDAGSAEYSIKRDRDAAARLLRDARQRAQAIADQAKKDNPLIREEVKAVFAEYGVPLRHRFMISSQVEEMLEGLKERFDADTRIEKAQKHIAEAAKAVGASVQTDQERT